MAIRKLLTSREDLGNLKVQHKFVITSTKFGDDSDFDLRYRRARYVAEQSLILLV
jgi:hypothetical protein